MQGDRNMWNTSIYRAIQFSLFLGMAMTFSSCFIEDEPIQPHEQGDAIQIQIDESTYLNQIYFDFSSDSVVGMIPNNTYQLEFESGEQGWHIRLNTADNIKICRIENLSFEEVLSIPDSADWVYDSSDGDLDSTAIGAWVDTTTNPYTYSGHVYLIGRFNGIDYLALKKLQFISVDALSYQFRLSNIDGSANEVVTVPKDETHDYIFVNVLHTAIIPQLPQPDWDIVFTSYSTTLYTNDGIPTPYNVRGTFINESKVQVALDTLYLFEELDYSYMDSLTFSSRRDIIGHDWKYYNGEDYVVRTGLNFILLDADGFYYKFRFTNYHNSIDQVGYPGFEMQRL